MKIIWKLSALLLIVLGLASFSPWLFVHIAIWQKAFNQLISDNLHQIQTNTFSAGAILVLASFAYGVLHALGPGHGKFIIASYLATHKSQLKQSTLLSFLSSLMQGMVAISATTVLVLILNLSSRYFKLGQLWLERAALILLVILGIYWIKQGINVWKKKHTLRVNRLTFIKQEKISAIKATHILSPQSCSCGHQHLPSVQQTQNATNLRAQFLIILSIGMRPCSGAIFVLFLAYMLDLSLWGMLAVLAMSLGTGFMLSAFATLVHYARNTAVNLGHWYGKKYMKGNRESLIKIIIGIMMIFIASSLLYGTTLNLSGGAALFGR